jgi:SAM-dependent methyltransferase
VTNKIGKSRLKEFYEDEAKETAHQEMMYAKGNKHELWWHRKRLSYILDFVEEIFKETRIANFLEVGCAEGLYVNHVASRHKGTYCLGLDIARAYVEKARLKSSSRNTDFVLGDIESLPFRDDSVDLVLCSEVLEHIYRYRLSACELCRVSRKRLIVSFPGSTYVYRAIQRLDPLRNFIDEQTASVGHVSRVTLEELRKSLRERCSFDKVRIGGALPVQIYSAVPSIRVVEAIDSFLCRLLGGFRSLNDATIHVVKMSKKTNGVA